MNAKQYLIERLKMSKIQADGIYEDYIKATEEYARLQIEKDRLQIIEKCALTLSSEYIIKELPIALD